MSANDPSPSLTPVPFGWFARFLANPHHEIHRYGEGGYQYAYLPIIALETTALGEIVPVVVEGSGFARHQPLSIEFFPSVGINPLIYTGESLRKHPLNPGAYWYRDLDWVRFDDPE